MRLPLSFAHVRPSSCGPSRCTRVRRLTTPHIWSDRPPAERRPSSSSSSSSASSSSSPSHPTAPPHPPRPTARLRVIQHTERSLNTGARLRSPDEAGWSSGRRAADRSRDAPPSTTAGDVPNSSTVGGATAAASSSRKLNLPPSPSSPFFDPEEGSEASDIRGSSSASSSSGSASSSSSSNSSSSGSGDKGRDSAALGGLRSGGEPAGPKLSLLLPKNVRMGYYSAYPELTGLMQRIPALRAMHRDEQCPDALSLSRIRIGPLLGAGRTWTVYGATADAAAGSGEEPTSAAQAHLAAQSEAAPRDYGSAGLHSASSLDSTGSSSSSPASPSNSSPSPFPPLVVKLFSPDITPFPRAPNVSSTSSPTPVDSSQLATEAKENLRAALFEAEMYAGPLRSLQGTAVPRYFGVYSGADDEGQWLYALILERVGRAIHRRRDGTKGSWEALLPQQRRAVAALYAKVHAAGVVHGDIELRHVRTEVDSKGGRGGLRLIDFEGARQVNKVGMLEKERRQLDKCIGVEWRRWLGVPGP